MLSILFVGAFLAAMGAISVGSITAMIGYFTVFNSVIGKVNFIIREAPIVNNLVERLTFFTLMKKKSKANI